MKLMLDEKTKFTVQLQEMQSVLIELDKRYKELEQQITEL